MALTVEGMHHCAEDPPHQQGRYRSGRTAAPWSHGTTPLHSIITVLHATAKSPSGHLQ
jgi:hypothetical protein